MGIEAGAPVWGFCAASVATFAVGFRFSGILRRAVVVLGVAREARALLADRTLDDLEKERWLQRAALGLFAQFVRILIAVAAVLALAAGVLWLGDLTALAPLADSLALLSRWPVILGASLLFLALHWPALARRRPR